MHLQHLILDEFSLRRQQSDLYKIHPFNLAIYTFLIRTKYKTR